MTTRRGGRVQWAFSYVSLSTTLPFSPLTVPPSSPQFDQFYPREIRRNRRTWERVAGGLAVLTLIYFLILRPSSSAVNTNGAAPFVPRKSGGSGKGKMKNPLKSNIPLHSFRANLKEGHGYVTSFPYGGLSTSSSFSLAQRCARY
jgi:hypothetical protein